jgi:hypothetical protein
MCSHARNAPSIGQRANSARLISRSVSRLGGPIPGGHPGSAMHSNKSPGTFRPSRRSGIERLPSRALGGANRTANSAAPYASFWGC